jgi:hypothetical protein
MSGGLALAAGALYVGTAETTAHIHAYDLDGHPLAPAFHFRGEEGGPAHIAGLAADRDRRLWIADRAGPCLWGFSVFGKQFARVGGEEQDRTGAIGVPVGVASVGEDTEQELVVASRGRRRHALHILPVEAGRGDGRSLRPQGHHDMLFDDLVHVDAVGDRILVCERRVNRVQIFREREFHYAIEPEMPVGAELACARLLEDGRIVCAFRGSTSGVLLLDRRGRRMRLLAEGGEEEGCVFEPSDLVVEAGVSDAGARVWILDRDGCRVQVFTLSGRCHGSFPEFPPHGE